MQVIALFIENEIPPAPKLINAKKTKYVYPNEQSSTTSPSNFAEWNSKLQRPIINKNYLFGVLPCANWSICNDNELNSQVYQAKLLFHRQEFTS